MIYKHLTHQTVASGSDSSNCCFQKCLTGKQGSLESFDKSHKEALRVLCAASVVLYVN